MSFRILYKSSRRSAFSLVELLVCVGIIGLLASLLVPGLNKMIESSRSAKCMGSMKNIGVAMQAYASDHDGRLPAAASNSDAGGSPNQYGNWYVELSPYYGYDGKVLSQWLAKTYATINCPTYIAKYKTNPAFNTGWVGYGMNNRLLVNDDFSTDANIKKTAPEQVKIASIPHPSRTILVAEGTGLNFDLYSTYKFVPSTSEFEKWNKGGTPDRHGTTSNYLFVDGHIETLGLEAAQEAARPHPGT